MKVKLIVVFAFLLTYIVRGQEVDYSPIISPSNINMLQVKEIIPAESVFGFGLEFSHDFLYLLTFTRMENGVTNVRLIETDNQEVVFDMSVESEENLIQPIISPDNQYAVLRDGKHIWIWQIESGELIETFRDSGNRFVSNYSFSQDARYFAFSSQDEDESTINIYDTTTNEIVIALERDNVERVFISPNGETIITQARSVEQNDFELGIWNLDFTENIIDLQATYEPELDNDFIDFSGFTDNGQYVLISIGNETRIERNYIVWDTVVGDEIQRTLLEQPIFLPRDYTNLVGINPIDNEDTLIFMDAITLTSYSLLSMPNLLDISPNNSIAISSGESLNEIKFWDIRSGEQLWELKNANNPEFSDDGRYLMTFNIEDFEIYIWSIIE